MVLFTVYFPIRAREFESKGYNKYIHLITVVCAVIFPAFLVGIQYGMGGYTRTVVPIFCISDTSSAFVFAVIPISIISAILVTLVMILLFKIFNIGGWKVDTKVHVCLNIYHDAPQSVHTTKKLMNIHVHVPLKYCLYVVLKS